MDHPDANASAERLIDDVGQLQRRTRKARQGFWFPLLMLGFLALGATPLYFRHVSRGGVPVAAAVPTVSPSQGGPPPNGLAAQAAGGLAAVRRPCAIGTREAFKPCASTLVAPFRVGFFPTGATSDSGDVAAYWLIGLPATYALIGFWYRRRAIRRGVATKWLPFVTCGIALLGVLVLSSPQVASTLHITHRWIPGDLTIRGVEPLLTVAIGLIILSWCERSRSLLAFALCFLALALGANLYDFANLAHRMGINVGIDFAPAIGLFLCGIVLALGGTAFGITRRLTR